jgi:molybdate transport system ATP-binding protein
MLKVDVRKRLGALDLDCAFEAGPGVTILFGRSGSGKTSLLNMIAGLLRPDAGRIAFDGEALSDSRTGAFTPPHRRRFGTVFQDALLFPHMNVRANLDFARKVSAAPRRGEVLQTCGEYGNSTARTASAACAGQSGSD